MPRLRKGVKLKPGVKLKQSKPSKPRPIGVKYYA